MGMTKRSNERATQLGSAKAILYELQVEQHHHDETYHREIARLSLHQRLNHMALHFAKYAGRVAAADTTETIIHTYVDTLIIALSTANILNIEIWSLLDDSDSYFPGLLAFGRVQAQIFGGALENRSELLRKTSVAAGIIAGACEKVDHLEEISFRSEIKRGLATLASLALAVLAQNGVEPAHAVRSRLASVKSRLKLHGRI